jgi:hypothetical protein
MIGRAAVDPSQMEELQCTRLKHYGNFSRAVLDDGYHREVDVVSFDYLQRSMAIYES